MLGPELRRLRQRRPEVAGTVLAGTDGMLISSDLPSTDATHLAALAAASFGSATGWPTPPDEVSSASRWSAPPPAAW
ncbi:roadblock/LC7 domain-containing protein [Micromonospora sp. M12]